MKPSLILLSVATLSLAAFACSDNGGNRFTETPVAPQASDLTAVTGAVASRTLICHHNPDGDDDPAFEWFAISVANGDKYLSNHSDDCILASGAVGEECTCETAAITPLGNVNGASKQDKYLICHNDVDDDEAYDSIAIEVNGNSLDNHFANHGDCYTADEPGTENCSCVA